MVKPEVMFHATSTAILQPIVQHTHPRLVNQLSVNWVLVHTHRNSEVSSPNEPFSSVLQRFRTPVFLLPLGCMREGDLQTQKNG